jgi:LEA14-like dessication related protein
MTPAATAFPTALRALALAAVLALLGACASMGLDFDDPEVELVGLRPVAGNAMEARFVVSLRIVNPNPIPLEVDGMAYEVSIRGSKLLSGVSNEGLNIPAYGESTADLEVAAGMLGSLSLIRDLISNPSGESLPYELKAKLSRKGIPVPLRITREGSIDLGNLGSGRRSL